MDKKILFIGLFALFLLAFARSVSAEYLSTGVIDNFDRASIGNNWSNPSTTIIQNRLFEIYTHDAFTYYNQTYYANESFDITFYNLSYDNPGFTPRERFGIGELNTLFSAGGKFYWSQGNLFNDTHTLGSYTYPINTNFSFRFKYNDEVNVFYFKMWDTLDEPTNWNLTQTSHGNYEQKLYVGLEVDSGGGSTFFHMESLLNNSIGSSYDNINISTTEPIALSQFSTNTINFNATVNASFDFNCTKYLNGTANGTREFSAGTDVFVSWNETLVNGIYNYSFSCGNSTDIENTTDTLFYVDAINPTIQTAIPSYFTIFNSNISYQINFTDDISLFSYDITIDGIYPVANKTNLTGTFAQINMSQNITFLNSGFHTLYVTTADGHTATELLSASNWDTKTGLFDDYLKFEWTYPYKIGEVTIKEKDSSIFDKWAAIPSFDRYRFDYTPSTAKDTYVFEVESDKEIKIIKDSNTPYKEWIIIDDHWVDFYVPTQKDMRISIEYAPKTNKKVEVTLSGIDSKLKTLNFESAGDLNIITQNYTFYKINVTTIYLDPIFETQTQQIIFNITKPNISTSTKASFLYDSTSYSLNKFTNADSDRYEVTFTTPSISALTEQKYFNFSFNFSDGIDYVLNATADFNQTVNKISIGNCSNANFTRAVTFILKDEETDANKTGTLNIDLDVWYESESQYREFSFAFSNNHEYGICIYPNSTNYTVNAIMEYQADNYSNRKYYLDDYFIDNQTDTIYLYLLNNSQTTEVIMKVFDKATGQAVEGAFVKILRYFPEGNSSENGGTYKLVEIEKTDSAGEALGKIILTDVFYKFIVDYERVTRLTTDVSKVLTTTKLLPISLFASTLDSASRIGNVDIEVSCDKDTKICRVEWNDQENLVQTVKFEIYRTNMFGKKLIYSDETSSAAGSMVYTIVEDTEGNTYRAVAHIKTNTKYSFYSNIAEAFLNFKESFKFWGGIAALFPAMLLIISVIFALMASIGAVGVIAGSILAIIGLTLLGILELSATNIMILIALGGILIAKIRQ